MINEMARVCGLKANVSVRINPDIDAHTHKYVTTGLYENKFGISRHEFDKLIGLVQKSENINFIGLHFHIGSQITRVEEVYALECRRVNEIVAYFERNGLEVKNINLGGGLGSKTLLYRYRWKIWGTGTKFAEKGCGTGYSEDFAAAWTSFNREPWSLPGKI